MDELMKEIRAYAAQRGIRPATVVQYATGQQHGAWYKWEKGGTCTMETAGKLRRYIAENPPQPTANSEGAAA